MKTPVTQDYKCFDCGKKITYEIWEDSEVDLYERGWEMTHWGWVCDKCSTEPVKEIWDYRAEQRREL